MRILSLAFLIACVSNIHSQEVSGSKVLDRSNMDFTANPGDDFRQYANGAWIQKNPVPAKETRWGSFSILHDFNVKAVRVILNEAQDDKTAAEGSITRRVGDFYASAMDSALIEKMGFTPIKGDYDRAGSVKTTTDVLNEIIYQYTRDIGNPLFSFNVSQDRKRPTVMAVLLGQGGTTLPDRDYYLKSDPRSKKVQAAFDTYMTTLFKLAGATEEQAKQNANSIFELEKKLAAAQLSRVILRDPVRAYNKLALADLGSKTPHIDWTYMFAALQVGKPDSIIINNPDFFASADSVLASTPPATCAAYLQWNILRGIAAFLSKPFVDANFAYNQVLNGQKVLKPRWERMASLTDNQLGDLLGQLYVDKHFKPAAKANMDEMIKNLVKAYEIRIKGLDWMSDATKEKALAKLAAFTPKIGYTTKWKTYEGVVITRDNFMENLNSLGAWQYRERVDQLGKPVDKTRFNMTPPTVNAYYSAVNNEIVFPAGMLQYPFFNPEADDAVNYGAIGAIIGHEISHGFDDAGSQFDKDGTLRNWWTTEDREKFMAKAKLLQEQFDAYTVLDTIHVNGKLTLGENIGDLGGLNAAYEAFKMTDQWKSKKKIDGFTPDQRFFLSWAQAWRSNTVPETKAQYIITDTHSPDEYRTIGPCVNMDAWYEAFKVKPSNKLYKKPEDRIKIW